MGNKLFCTFSNYEDLDNLVDHLSKTYTILYNKIFVLKLINNVDYVCTYNIDLNNTNGLPKDTILVHRKKETNTLYTINALNELIKQLNNNILDEKYQINWKDYQNSLMLIQNNILKIFKTKIYKIVEINDF